MSANHDADDLQHTLSHINHQSSGVSRTDYSGRGCEIYGWRGSCGPRLARQSALPLSPCCMHKSRFPRGSGGETAALWHFAQWRLRQELYSDAKPPVAKPENGTL